MSAPPFDLDQFATRLVRDAINEKSRRYWLRRAEEFAAAMPAANDYRGATDAGGVVDQVLRIKAKVDACRNRAALCSMTDNEERLALGLMEEMLSIEPVVALWIESDMHERMALGPISEVLVGIA